MGNVVASTPRAAPVNSVDECADALSDSLPLIDPQLYVAHHILRFIAQFVPFIDSRILSPRQYDKLSRMSDTFAWRLIYRATRDGFNSNVFHALCDGKGPRTITVLRMRDDEKAEDVKEPADEKDDPFAGMLLPPADGFGSIFELDANRHEESSAGDTESADRETNAADEIAGNAAESDASDGDRDADGHESVVSHGADAKSDNEKEDDGEEEGDDSSDDVESDDDEEKEDTRGDDEEKNVEIDGEGGSDGGDDALIHDVSLCTTVMLLNDCGHVYVCGDHKKLAPGVYKALIEIVTHHGVFDF